MNAQILARPINRLLVACWLFGAVVGASAPTLAFAASSGFTYAVVHSFLPKNDGKRYPQRLTDGVVLARDGWLYGVSSAGGADDNGTAFRVWPETGEAVVLHRFGKTPGDGIDPVGPLIEQADGHFMGASAIGGAFGWGTVFRMHPEGHVRVLHDFAGGTVDGAFPDGPPILATDGRLYGTTGGGGAHEHGTIYRLGPDREYEVLYSFHGQHRGDGDSPVAPLIQAPDGRFYGITREGGAHGRGTLFRIAADRTYEVLHSFVNGPLGTHPIQPLMLASDGQLYGSTNESGDFGYGTIFRVGTDGRPQTLHAVDPQVDGVRVTGALVEAPDRRLYYAMAFGPKPTKGAVMRIDPATGAAETLFQIQPGTDGTEIMGTLAVAADGSLFGTTFISQRRNGSLGGGLVFRLRPN